ncbi:MAG: [protein-PII] uridylyltransferase [Pirellulales bacterium]
MAAKAGTGGLPAAVLQARKRLLEGRQKLRAQHDAGSPGLQVCVRLADLVDSVLLELYEAACIDLNLTHLTDSVTLVAHGGYGRRDVAPYSDVDLMLLHDPRVTDAVVPLARRLSQWVVDAGCQLGFSVRTPAQALKLSWTDTTIFTSLVESRLLTGSNELFANFLRGLRQGAKRRTRRLIRSVVEARLEERRKYGDIVYLLEPNIKRSRGGLRDIQLVRWIGFAAYGECDLDQLAQLQHLTPEDHRALRKGYQYLLRLRNQMHFEAGKSQDLLDRPLQMQLAAWAGFQGSDGMLPVEQFMKDYFENISEIRYSSAHFVQTAQDPATSHGILSRIFSRRVERDYQVGWHDVWATPVGLERVKRDPAAVLQLMSIANRFDKPIDHYTWREIRSAMLNRASDEITPETIERFMQLLEQPRHLADSLRRLHELRVLEQIIPDVKHARCLLQFNQYHKYTVDAHSIRAVECVTELLHNSTLLGILYRDLPSKGLLHLALLINDLGKGFAEDHSDVGLRIAEATADRLRLSQQDKETLMFLIHKHLLMANTAFRLDLNSDESIVPFAATVGSSERLRLLLLLTYADLASVGPEVVNQWKCDLLLQLYHQTDSHFRDDKPGERFRNEIESRRKQVLDLIPEKGDATWWQEQISSLPIGYLLRTQPSQILQEIDRLRALEGNAAVAWGRFSEAQRAVEYTVAIRQTGEPIGTFHRITGSLSSQGMQILAAEIHTQPGDIAWDRFLVEDSEYDGAPPAERIDQVCRKVVQALDPESGTAPTFPRIWRNSKTKAAEGLKIQPTQVRFDNTTSDKHTIITLFAYDRMGLLYDVSKVLFDMKLVLHFAKIGTHLDQVVDVFYVTELSGAKIQESTRLYMIRQRLLRAVSNES